MRKAFKEAMEKLGVKVKFANKGDSWFSPRSLTSRINKKTATAGTLMDEYAHAFNSIHGKGKYLPDELADMHRRLAEKVRNGGTDALNYAENELYHQLELLNMLRSGQEMPSFIKGIPIEEIRSFLGSLSQYL